jgi:hypothetical protein
VLDTPFALFAENTERAAEELRRRQKAYGLDSISTQSPRTGQTWRHWAR